MTKSTRLFFHSKSAKTFSAEISTIGNFQRLYTDGCDIGLELVSEKTGYISVWYISDVDKDGEGDMRFWVLYPTAESLDQFPGLRGYKMVIYND